MHRGKGELILRIRKLVDTNILAVREEIMGAITLGHSEGLVLKEDRDRILGALDLGDRTVDEIMKHRSEIEMIDAASSPREILEQCLQSPHTRLPIFRGDKENVVGVIHAKDLLRAMYAHQGRRGESNGTADGFMDFNVTLVSYIPCYKSSISEQGSYLFSSSSPLY